jgi:HD superfamily phosphohydrolase
MEKIIIIIAAFIAFIGLLFLQYFFYKLKFSNCVNIYDENIVKIIKERKYKNLEIKRKRKMKSRVSVSSMFTDGYNEYPLDEVIPSPVFTPEDIIEIHGIINKNYKVMIFRKDWSLEEAQKLRAIVSQINDELNQSQSSAQMPQAAAPQS